MGDDGGWPIFSYGCVPIYWGAASVVSRVPPPHPGASWRRFSAAVDSGSGCCWVLISDEAKMVDLSGAGGCVYTPIHPHTHSHLRMQTHTVVDVSACACAPQCQSNQNPNVHEFARAAQLERRGRDSRYAECKYNVHIVEWHGT